jgi:hypothetical protein
VSGPVSGVAAVGLDLAPEVVSVEAGAFAEFRKLKTASAPPVKPGPRAPGVVRVRRLESMGVLVRSAEPGMEPSASQMATAKSGQRAQVRVVMDPTALRAGSDVPVRVYAEGRAVAGGLVTATNVTTGEAQTVTCDSSGIGLVHIGAVGSWRVEFHHVVASPDGDADWNAYTATLSFEVTRPAKEAE